MSIFNHNIYDNVRTRVILLDAGHILLLRQLGAANWRCPGGGLEPGESLAECAAREVREETGLAARIGRVAFLREWVAPTHCQPPECHGRHGFGLEVFFYAAPAAPAPLRPEPGDEARWHPLAAVAALRVWPIELKSLAPWLLARGVPEGAAAIVADFNDPSAQPAPRAWAGSALARQEENV